jgi:hypothetical protein
MDPSALTDTMLHFAHHPELIATMGAQSRRRAESTYDVRKVNRAMLDEIGLP